MYYFRKIKFAGIIATQFLLAMNFYGHSQQDMANTLVNSLTTYSRQNLQEKIFIHTDKSFYTCGEIIWFKLYNVDACLNKPITISKIAYVELLSGDHKPVFQAKIELKDGSGSGSFILPFSLNSGSYVLRAYTNWMKNYGPDLFFETQLTIINTLKKLNTPGNDSSTYDIRFFPEGGNLVNGFQSKIAFHAVDKNGKGIFCKGTVYNQNNDSITSFQALRFGMGHFSFTPAKGDSYRALVQTTNGETITRVIPAAFENGYVMRLDPTNDGAIKVLVHSSYNESLILLVHTRQVPRLAETKMITNGVAEFTINKKELGEGVSHLTLFNSKRQPVCERLYFLLPKEKMNLGVNTDQAEYERRKKVSLQLKALESKMLPVNADLSLSVFMADSLQDPGESDIQSYLWLSSELKGSVESPLHYFNSMDSDITDVTDNLMLTQGWSRFKWEDILNNHNKTSLKFLPEYEGPLITGKIVQRASGLPVKNVTTWMTVPGERFVLRSYTSDQNGHILFNPGKFYGSNELIVQYSDQLKTPYTIHIDNAFAENFSSRKYPSLRIDKKWQDQLLSYSVNTQVENTYVQDKKQKFYHYKPEDSTAFYGKPDKTYLLDDYTRFITMEEVMREFVAEVRVRKQQDQLTFKVKHLPYQVFFENAPLVLLDGLPVFDMNKLMEFDPLKIKKLEVVAKKFYSGNDAIEGIVSYTTYKGNLDGFQADPNALVLEYEGLQLQREFYSPMYSTKEQAESRLPDFRNLLFWSPDIKTDETGNKQIEFYTSDRPGKYAVVVQGIDSNGIAGSKIVYFTVKK